jgi:hypothetical protein
MPSVRPRSQRLAAKTPACSVVAYSFKPRFVEPILDGHKGGTSGSVVRLFARLELLEKGPRRSGREGQNESAVAKINTGASHSAASARLSSGS